MDNSVFQAVATDSKFLIVAGHEKSIAPFASPRSCGTITALPKVPFSQRPLHRNCFIGSIMNLLTKAFFATVYMVTNPPEVMMPPASYLSPYRVSYLSSELPLKANASSMHQTSHHRGISFKALPSSGSPVFMTVFTVTIPDDFITPPACTLLPYHVSSPASALLPFTENASSMHRAVYHRTVSSRQTVLTNGLQSRRLIAYKDAPIQKCADSGFSSRCLAMRNDSDAVSPFGNVGALNPVNSGRHSGFDGIFCDTTLDGYLIHFNTILSMLVPDTNLDKTSRWFMFTVGRIMCVNYIWRDSSSHAVDTSL